MDSLVSQSSDILDPGWKRTHLKTQCHCSPPFLHVIGIQDGCRKVKEFTNPLEPAKSEFFNPQQTDINLSERLVLFQLKRQTGERRDCPVLLLEP